MFRGNEFLLHNSLAKGFQRMLRPLYIIQSLFFVNKFHIKYNFITTNSKVHYVGTVLVNSAVLFLFFATMHLSKFGKGAFGTIYSIVYFQNFLSFALVCLLNACQSKTNVSMLLKQQQIERGLRLEGYSCTEKYIKMNWILVATVLLMYALFVTLKIALDPNWNWARCLLISTTAIFDLEVIYSTAVTSFLASSLRLWQLSVNGIPDACAYTETREEISCNLEDVTENAYKIFEAILNAFSLSKIVFRFPILVHVVLLFLQSLIYLQVLIFWIKREESELDNFTSHTVGIFLWLFKGLLFETLLCSAYEKFDGAICDARAKCVTFIKKDNDRLIRRLSKNVVRLSYTNYCKMCACGVFTVDAALPLKLGGLVATYCVVLLQFAFL